MDKKEQIGKALTILSKNIPKLKIDNNDKSITFGNPFKDIWITLRETTVYTPAVVETKTFLGFKLWDEVVAPKKSELKGSLYVNIGDYSFSDYIDYRQFESIFNTASRLKEARFNDKLNKYSNDKENE